MKESTKGTASLHGHSELDMLLTLARKVAALRDEFEALSLGKVCDGIFSDQFSAAQTRLDDILLCDLATPMHTCVIEELVNHAGR